MQFTDIAFIIVILPVALVCYYLVSAKNRQLVLIAYSLFFYSGIEPKNIIVLVVSMAVNVLLTKLIIYCNRYRRLILCGTIVFNVSMLAVFKYSASLVVPVGLSFYTFKAISLIIDAYKGEIKEVDAVSAVRYLCFFPQVISGPISRYGYAIESEQSFELFYEGIIRFMAGISKKVLIANFLYNITSEVFEGEVFTTSLCWLGSICFSLQLFFDFSGYSDMAIGLSNMFGYRCEENFEYPYCTKNVSDFWKRWHITLGSFFRDYVYIPLGGSRKGMSRTVLNLFVVWALTGIWHGNGLTYIVWGLLYFCAISFEKITGISGKLREGIGAIIYRILVLMFINVQWVIFNSKTIGRAETFIKNMFVLSKEKYTDLRALFLLKHYFAVIFVAIILCMPIFDIISSKVADDKKLTGSIRVIKYATILIGFVISLSFIINGHNSPFVYANF